MSAWIHPKLSRLFCAVFAGIALQLGAAEPSNFRGEITPPEMVPPGYAVVEGDILVRLDRPKATFQADLLWPNGIVYYELDANVSAAERTVVTNAMAQWAAVANLTFTLRTTQANYIHIQDSSVANSEVGMIGGQQLLNFGFSSFPFFSLVHELGHALGYYHEQSRTDRDTYVTIVTNNIEDGKLHNFNKEASSSHYGPYDFDSVMHSRTVVSLSAATALLLVGRLP